jgi:AcrR family transcriptional regulator
MHGTIRLVVSQDKSRRRPRGSLTSEAIVDAAIELVHHAGLEALTMRALARRLDVPVTSVHWHYRTRDDLLDVIAARMAIDFYDSMPTVDPDGEWAREIRKHLSALRQQLLDKRSFLDLSFDRVGSLVNDPDLRGRMSERLEAEVAVLARAGLTPEDAYRFYDVCSTYVRGFVLVELAHARATRPIAPGAQLFLDPEAFPVMSQTQDKISLSWHDADDQFEVGLDLLLGSIEARASRAPASVVGRARSTRTKPRSS